MCGGIGRCLHSGGGGRGPPRMGPPQGGGGPHSGMSQPPGGGMGRPLIPPRGSPRIGGNPLGGRRCMGPPLGGPPIQGGGGPPPRWGPGGHGSLSSKPSQWSSANASCPGRGGLLPGRGPPGPRRPRMSSSFISRESGRGGRSGSASGSPLPSGGRSPSGMSRCGSLWSPSNGGC